MQVVNNQQQHFQYIQPPYHENYINIYKGYFQSEKFFQNQEELLKNYFHNQDLINKFQYIKNLNYASLHIKRGNCLNLQMQHLILPKEYYDVAVSAIKYDKLLIFSNDINWCKENLDYPNIVYIEEKDYISLYMMSQCTSHIIANSTFSWWGAKFSEWYGSPDKILTPDVWFGPTLSDLNTNDIIPDRWTKIKC